MKYKKKPVVIEAFQWAGGIHRNEDPEWIAEAIRAGDVWIIEKAYLNQKPVLAMYIRTLEGIHMASPGDYIIRGVQGELYPCKPDIFRKTYELA